MLLMFTLAAASAHVGELIGGIDVVADDEGADVEASWGLVLRDGAGFAWVCHEAITAPGAIRSPRYARAADGAWFGWLPDPLQGRDGATLFRTDDGCDWTPPTGLDGVIVTGASPDPSDTTRVLAVSATPGGADTIWESSDGGHSFAAAFPPDPDRRFSSVTHGAGGAWATATDAAGARAFVWFRPTGGDWAEQEPVLPPGTPLPVHLRLLDTGPGGTAWWVLDPLGADRVMRTDDGGATAVIAHDPGGAVVDGAVDGDTLYVLVDGLRLDRVVPSGVTAVPDFPLSIGVAARAGTLWTAPQSFVVGSLLEASVDGGPFETRAWPDDVLAPLSCPAGSDVARACEPLWESLLPRIRGFDGPGPDSADTGTPAVDPGPDRPAEAEPGCGCDQPGAPVAGWWVVGLLALRRRR